jgi:hypothetical protein
MSSLAQDTSVPNAWLKHSAANIGIHPASQEIVASLASLHIVISHGSGAWCLTGAGNACSSKGSSASHSDITRRRPDHQEHQQHPGKSQVA